MSSEPVYLTGDAEGVFGLYDDAPARADEGSAVLLCPPFGWDEVCSYRPRRAWALHLARCGRPALRIDLPGAGDSAGTAHDPARLTAWIAAVGGAAGWLRERSGADRVVACGIGLGGVLAYLAAAGGQPVDDLVLWAVPARGRSLLREMRAFARLEASEFGAGSSLADEPPEGALAAGGFLLAPETVRELETLDLTHVALERPRERRVLLLRRGATGVDGRLERHLSDQGVELAVAPGRGYGAMVAPPHQARAPVQAFSTVDEWLAGGRGEGVSPSPSRDEPAAARRSIALETPDATVRERPYTVVAAGAELPGVLAEPTGRDDPAPLGVVLLNAGLMRRIGPGRMWVELARRWAGRGVPSLRIDLQGIGDADGEEGRYADVAAFHEPEVFDQTLSVVDDLVRAGVARRFVLVGLCSGAAWAFEGAQRHPRVVAAVMVNPRSLIFDPAIEAQRDARKAMTSIGRGWAWRRLLTGDVSRARALELVRQTVRTLLTFPVRLAAQRRVRRIAGDTAAALDRLRDGGKQATFVFVEGEPLRDDLERWGILARRDAWPNVRFDHVAGGSHTLRPIASQRHVHALLDDAIARELERTGARGEPLEVRA